MNPLKGLKNLFHAPSKGGPHDPPAVRFEVADNQMKVDMIWDLLAEQIGERRNQRIPKPRPNPDDLFRPTLIGAWAEERLVGGAFVMPDLEDAAYYSSLGYHDTAQFLSVRTTLIQGIAVIPECRNMGIGTRIKRQCGLWSKQHGGILVLSIVTNDAAARMNKKAGYHVLPPLVTLVVQAVYQGRTVANIGLPFDDSQPRSRWAWGLAGRVDGLTVRIGLGGVAEG